MRSSEWVSTIYFALILAAAWLRRLAPFRRVRISAIALTMIAAVHVGSAAAPFARDWITPLLAILVGYYVSGLFFITPTRWFEEMLLRCDRRLFGDPATRFARWPRVVLAYLDVVYIGCFLLVPAGVAALTAAGRAADANRYWTMVIGAELGSFLPLTVLQSRPPWIVERKAVLPDRAIHRAASLMVEHVTIRANTFPSGHVAGSLAVALGVVGALPVTGAVLLTLATSIAIACVVGRYHYVLDVAAGVALALLMWMIVT